MHAKGPGILSCGFGSPLVYDDLSEVHRLLHAKLVCGA
jgi:hypothetical protein